MRDFIDRLVTEHQRMISELEKSRLEDVQNLAEAIVKTLQNGGKPIVFGNGGSAADAQHFVCELVGTFKNKSRKALPAISLTTNSSSLTSISNDFSYEDVFTRQVEGLARPEDLCIGISTSGNSQNVLNALSAAKKSGCATGALLGAGGGKIGRMADHTVIVPSDNTPVIQEGHIMIIHIICGIVDEAFSD